LEIRSVPSSSPHRAGAAGAPLKKETPLYFHGPAGKGLGNTLRFFLLSPPPRRGRGPVEKRNGRCTVQKKRRCNGSHMEREAPAVGRGKLHGTILFIRDGNAVALPHISAGCKSGIDPASIPARYGAPLGGRIGACFPTGRIRSNTVRTVCPCVKSRLLFFLTNSMAPFLCPDKNEAALLMPPLSLQLWDRYWLRAWYHSFFPVVANVSCSL